MGKRGAACAASVDKKSVRICCVDLGSVPDFPRE